MSTDDERFNTPGGQQAPAGTPGQFDNSGFPGTSTTPGMSTTQQGNKGAQQQPEQSGTPDWHAGLDLGLLLLRVALGGVFIVHGLQKFGLFGGLDGNGGGLGTFAGALEGAGYSQTTILAWVTALTELGAGVLLVIGLFTALAGAGVLGVMANAIIAMKASNGFFAGNGGIEYELILGMLALGLMFTGAGRASLDRRSRWFSHAPAFGLVCLLLAAGLTVVTLVVLR